MYGSFTKGKAAIAKLDRNDVNDHLVLGEGEIVKKELWKARPVRPDSLINAADAWDLFIKETSKAVSDFPYPKLNEFTRGLFPSQLFTVASGSGAGKSTICREFCHHFLNKESQGRLYRIRRISTKNSSRFGRY